MIRLENVSKHFVKNGVRVRALDGVTLEAPKGALALLRGPSGSGKTTLINVAAGLTRPTSGVVTVAGERLSSLGGRACAALRARRIAVVFQMFHLIPYLTALENVLLPAFAARGDDQLARARQLLAELGIAHRADHFPIEMSAGERQRCALARALLNRPEVILADEPTGNLDEASAAHVLHMLGTCRNNGATVLLVSHQGKTRTDDNCRFPFSPDLEFHLEEGRLNK